MAMGMGLPRSVAALVLFLILWREGEAATFTFVNRCTDTVWPGVLSNAGSARLVTTGFELPPGGARAVPAPAGWSGRLWARTGCVEDGSTGRLACATGDCGSGGAECNGAGAAPPATLAEFTLDGSGGLDFYDVSLVDGYNLPVLVEPSSSSGGGGSLTSTATCAPAGCAADLNAMCPAELRAGGGAACRSACDAFGRPEFCCSGAYANPTTCRPTAYSQVFKSACPRSYSYAFDDPTSTFTCSGGPDYTVTFCPGATPSGSQKSTTTTPATATPTTTTTTIPGTTMPGAGAMPGATIPGTATATPTTTMPGTTFTDATPDNGMPMPMMGGGEQGDGDGGVVLSGSETWMANMATGDLTAAAAPPASLSRLPSAAAALAVLLLHSALHLLVR
ncbi:thaumatin-like protein 1 [Oryza brachyantha]|uniref:thaumatin-like protein 1 n=1 Tax=Oryza brachyantha TaxID=4533 RepID=UPI001AD9D63A|nr:thaumatin-like protein 1 [Oryza brachyantha]